MRKKASLAQRFPGRDQTEPQSEPKARTVYESFTLQTPVPESLQALNSQMNLDPSLFRGKTGLAKKPFGHGRQKHTFPRDRWIQEWTSQPGTSLADSMVENRIIHSFVENSIDSGQSGVVDIISG